MLRYKSSLDAMRDATLFPIADQEHTLHMVSFKAMKIVPANFIIQKAIARGDLKPGGTVVETSSGNFALGMAIVCNRLKHRFVAIGDPAIEPSYKRQLEMLGGQVEIITDKKGSQGYQKARLDRLHEILDDEPGSFWCRQYDNEDNANAYAELGRELLAAVGQRLVLVAPVGSGGSSCGIAGALRAAGADCTLVGVDTFNSILFGQPDGPRKLRGLGNTVMPKNLKQTLFDDVHWVGSDFAEHFTRKLYASTGHFRGPTTGAAFAVARFVRERHAETPVVFLSPDDGSRYVDTTYAADPANAAYDTLAPQQIAQPTAYAPGSDWAWMNWQRADIQQYR
ncbi:pyridoxal-phosphate dependent enzyme [Paraburkholderia sp. BL21I4N1]|uniref:pyridoxal-phosphate dependent enzyme n=1 Tax=Paraburkholderia sp. BL21I4N1 TaxID=1938801 RepID=UPI000CFC7A78|nr:pyridoxal-phosphate dependent enzyme [Paraburkholderia sp. BL21I4N1]PQV46689.1 cysteine synthase A [Paraburkholderia sp. BL21I4N1]